MSIQQGHPKQMHIQVHSERHHGRGALSVAASGVSSHGFRALKWAMETGPFWVGFRVHVFLRLVSREGFVQIRFKHRGKLT
jgi:hypothetical protein